MQTNSMNKVWKTSPLVTLQICLFVFLLFNSPLSAASPYTSEIDDSVSIEKIAFLPVTDNVGGIYARPVEDALRKTLEGSHTWDYVEASGVVGEIYSPMDLEDQPEKAKSILSRVKADALLVVRITKGPKGTTIVHDLFGKSDGKLLLQETLRNHPHFEVKEIASQARNLFHKLRQGLPYQGKILSRAGQRVTLNLGKKDGVTPGQILTAVLVINIKRHPKFWFLISSEKEVLGKIKVEKVDDTLSFAIVLTEKERNAIQKGTKVSGLDFITYDERESFGAPGIGVGAYQKKIDKVILGDRPKEWVPTNPPTFGMVGVTAGLGSFQQNMALSAEQLDAKVNLYPLLTLLGELWITPNFIVSFGILQGVLSAKNPRTGSEPSSLSLALNRYNLNVGYNFLIRGDFFGPKVQIYSGFSSYSLFIDSSDPLGLTDMTYSGMSLGLKGSVPLTRDKRWVIGADLAMFLGPSLKENPNSSGKSSRNTINQFALFTHKRISERIRMRGSIDFSLYSTSFSGTGTRDNSETASSSSQKHTTLNFGVEYLF
jgi:hypothetical protein